VDRRSGANLLMHSLIELREQREEQERFGQAMFGASWIDGPNKLSQRQLASGRSQSAHTLISKLLYVHSGSRTVYLGSPSEAMRRALQRKHQIAAVRNALRLLQRYGAGTPPRPGTRYNCDQLERIDRGDSQRELEIARDVLWRMRHDEWVAAILDWLGRRRVFAAGRDCLLWHELTAVIDEEWLRKNSFEPPTINVRVLRHKIINAGWCDQPAPPLQAATSAAPDRGAPGLPPVLIAKNSSAVGDGHHLACHSGDDDLTKYVPIVSELASDEAFVQSFRLWVLRRRVDLNNHPLPDEMQFIQSDDLKAQIDPESVSELVRTSWYGVKGVLASDLLTWMARGGRPSPPKEAANSNAIANDKFSAATRAKSKKTIKAEMLCRQWLFEKMRQGPKEGRKSKYLQITKKEIPGLSDRAFDRAWAWACEESGSEWYMPGAPKKSLQQNLRTK
jgi:hypothetical protein